MKRMLNKGFALTLAVLLMLGVMPAVQAADSYVVSLSGKNFTVDLPAGTKKVDLGDLLLFLRDEAAFERDYTAYSRFDFYYTNASTSTSNRVNPSSLDYTSYPVADNNNLAYIRLYDSASSEVWYSINFSVRSTYDDAGTVGVAAGGTYYFTAEDFEVTNIPYSSSRVEIYFTQMPSQGTLYYNNKEISRYQTGIYLSNAHLISYKNLTGKYDSLTFSLRYYAPGDSTYTSILASNAVMDINITEGSGGAGNVTIPSTGGYTFKSADFEVVDTSRYTASRVYIRIASLPTDGTLYVGRNKAVVGDLVRINEANTISYENETGYDDLFRFSLIYYPPGSTSSYESLTATKNMTLSFGGSTESGQIVLNPRATYTFQESDFEVVNIPYSYSDVYVVIMTLPTEGTLYKDGKTVRRNDEIQLDRAYQLSYTNETGKSDSFTFEIYYSRSGSSITTTLVSGETMTFKMSTAGSTAGRIVVSANKAYTFQESDFEVVDIPYSPSLVYVEIQTLPSRGTLYYNRKEVARYQTFYLEDADLLTYESDDGREDSFRFSLYYERSSNSSVSLATNETMEIAIDTWSHAGPVISDLYIRASARSYEYYFDKADFTTLYERNGYSALKTVTIESLPNADKGTLYLGSRKVTAGQSLTESDLSSLVFEKEGGYVDPVTFTWSATDTRSNRSNLARVVITTEEHRPVLRDFYLAALKGATITLGAEHWQNSFTDLNGDKLEMVKITALPSAVEGTLYYNSAPVAKGDEIDLKNLGRLTFRPMATFSGKTSFSWNGCDASNYADDDAKCFIVVGSSIQVSAMDVTVEMDDANRFSFIYADFNSGFLHPQNLSASCIKINTQPNASAGTLYYEGLTVSNGAIIPLNNIASLRFETKKGFTGSASFTASTSADGVTFSDVYTVKLGASGATSGYEITQNSKADKKMIVTLNAVTPDAKYAISGTLDHSDIARIYDEIAFEGGTLVIEMPSSQSTTALSRALTLSTQLFTPDNLKKVSTLRVSDGITSLDIKLKGFQNAFVVVLDAFTIQLSNETLSDTTTAMNAGRARSVNISVLGVNMTTFGAGNVRLNIPYAPTTTNQDKAVIMRRDSAGVYTPMASSAFAAQSTANGIATGTVSAVINRPGTYVAAINSVSFNDVPTTEWYASYVNRLSARNVINGMGNGKFQPGGTLTRAQYIKLLVSAFNLDVTGAACSFTDVKSSDWHYSVLASAVAQGIITNGGTFRPDASITREDMCLFAHRAIVSVGGTFSASQATTTFSDEASITSTSRSAVKAMQGAGIINGYPDGSFKPSGSSTRAEASKVIQMLLEMYY